MEIYISLHWESSFAWVLIVGETTARSTRREKYTRPRKKNVYPVH